MPFKDRTKQLSYMRQYQKKRREELKEYEELKFLEEHVSRVARHNIVGRKLYSVTVDEDELRSYLRGQLLRLCGINIPIINKSFELTVDKKENLKRVENATMQVVEEEDKLLLVGHYKGWPALGIEGLATIPHRNIVKSTGDWYTDIAEAIKKLRHNNQKPPYKVVLNSKWKETFEEGLHKLGYYYSPFLCNSEGKQTNALVVKPSPKNFKVFIGNDLRVVVRKNSNGCWRGQVFEALTPIIEQPKAICEIQGINIS